MSSKPYKIFGHGRGIDISQASQGRNVQPFVSNKKIEQIVEKPIQAPFDGYTSSVSTNDNNLAYSQVNEINIELTRRIVKEQISKYNLGDQSKLKNDIQIMKTQIRSLKQFASQNEQKPKNDDELKKEIFREIDKVIQEYHDQTASKFREVIKKFDDSIKLDCSSKYLPLQFVGDVEKGFQGLEDRIQLLESKLDGTKKQRPTDDPVVIAEVFQLKLKKNDRELQSIKKIIAEIQSNLCNCNESINGIKARQLETEERYKKKGEEQKKVVARQQNETKILNDGIEQLKKKVISLEASVQSVQQKVSQFPPAWIERVQSTQSKDVKEFLNNSKNLVVSTIFESAVKQVKSIGQLKPQQIEEIIHRQSSNSLEEMEKKESQNEKQKEDICYRIDKYNFLLDEDGNYILNDFGRQIQLSEEQIVLLRNSTLVKLCQ